MGKDYYAILGVKKDASEDEIRKAYRKMALKWHPDRQANSGSGNTPEGAKKKFQEIGEAFEVLSDKNKRTVYDQYGEDGLKGGGAGPPPGAAGGAGGNPFAGFQNAGGGFGGGAPGGATFSFGGPAGDGSFNPSDPHDIFSSIFGAMGAGGLGGGGGGKGGMGGFPGMPGMGGGGMPGMGGGGMPGGMSGFDFGQAQEQGMPRHTNATAESEGGPKEVEKRLPCSLEELYNGAQRKLKVARTKDGQKEEKVLSVEVAKGWRAGTKVRFAGAGNQRSPGSCQDIVFVIEEKPHAHFRRSGDDLHVTHPLPLVDALDPPAAGALGSTRSITHLDGRKVSVPLPRPQAGSTSLQNGRTTRIANEGMPISKTKATTKGDLIVEWKIVLPERLDESKRQQLRQLLS